MSEVELAGGGAVTPDHAEINPATGQQKAYVVLSAEERAKGYVRPVRRTYVHVGAQPKYPTRALTDAENEQFAGYGYVAFEEYPASEAPLAGRFWTEEQLKRGCGTSTRMGQAIAETYARDPNFYSATFCCHCRKHLPLDQFVWAGSDERVGS